MEVTCERSQSTVAMPVQSPKHAPGITVMEAGHPFIDCSKVQKAKQALPISSQPKPSMVRRSLHPENAHVPIFLTSSIPSRALMPERENADVTTVVMAEPLRKLRLVRPLQR
jgi:hypothetical protein